MGMVVLNRHFRQVRKLLRERGGKIIRVQVVGNGHRFNFQQPAQMNGRFLQ